MHKQMFLHWLDPCTAHVTTVLLCQCVSRSREFGSSHTRANRTRPKNYAWLFAATQSWAGSELQTPDARRRSVRVSCCLRSQCEKAPRLIHKMSAISRLIRARKIQRCLGAASEVERVNECSEVPQEESGGGTRGLYVQFTLHTFECYCIAFTAELMYKIINLSRIDRLYNVTMPCGLSFQHKK